MAVRFADCTRRQHLKREASATRFAQTADASYPFQVLATRRHLTGFHCNYNCNRNGHGHGHGNRNRNGRCAERQRQRQPQRSLRGATSTGNGRCAELQATAPQSQKSVIWHVLTGIGISHRIAAPAPRQYRHPPEKKFLAQVRTA